MRRDDFAFEVLARDPGSRARTGRFSTPHGDVATPAFMPVGTKGTVKGIGVERLRELGSRMVLANTYHLHLRPGEGTVRALGGLHRFSGWDGPMLTDSGGYQVFSLADTGELDEDGVTFRSIVDGARVRFEPARVVSIQAALGADVAMAFDHCPSDPNAREDVERAVERTARWLDRCVRRHRELGAEARGQALFGIVQGGVFEDLRARSVEQVTSHDLVGYAVGGVSVGESREDARRAVAASAPLLPEDRPRYLMGVGTPRDFFDAIEQGIDLFDCVTPTRHGRTHQAFTREGKLNLRNARFALDDSPIDAECDCPACRLHSRGYLRHLCQAGEMLGAILLTEHNLRYFHALLERVRAAIATGELAALRERELAHW